jgi:hypothetical protein
MANSFAFLDLAKSQANRGVVVAQWTFDANGNGQAIPVGCFSDKTVAIKASAWGGGSISWYGSADGTNWDAVPLTDSLGDNLTATSDLRSTEVLQNVAWIRPVLSGATNPSLTAWLTAVARAPLA